MTPDAIVFWAFVAAWVVLGVLLIFVTVPRLVGEGRRLYSHLVALTDQSALALKIAKAEADATRVQAALEQVPRLQQRAEAAVGRIRATPVIPLALVDLAARIRLEWRAFLAELG